MVEFKNKVAWITGASSGIGRSLCFLLSGMGCKLIISSNESEALLTITEKIRKDGGECTAMPFDLGDQDSLQLAAQQATREHGRIDFLFNNGGISQRSFIHETPLEIDRTIMEVNYFANIALAKAVLPGMIRDGGGYIVVTSSLSGLFGFPLRSAYCASKHALHGFYETLRIEHLKDNIKVTIACPDRVRTSISLNALSADGKAYGQMDPRQDKGITPDECALEIIRALKKDKVIALIGGKERISVYIKRFFPRLFYRLITKVKYT